MAAEKTQKTPARQRRKRRLKIEMPTIGSLDRRTRAAQIVLELRKAICSDLGGEDRISAAQAQIVDRASMLSAVLEAAEVNFLKGEEFDAGQYATLAAVQARLLTSLGLKRTLKDVSPGGLPDLLRRKADFAAAEAMFR